MESEENSVGDGDVIEVNLSEVDKYTIVENNVVQIIDGHFCVNGSASVQFENDEMNEAQAIFKSWGLKDITCNVLKEYGFNSVEAIKSMSNEDLVEIFGKMNNSFFGQRSIIKRKLEEWKKQMNVPVTTCSDLLSASVEKILERLEAISSAIEGERYGGPSSTDTCRTITLPLKEPTGDDVRNILRSTINGEKIITYYDCFKKLDHKNQKMLTNCLVNFYQINNKKMCTSEMQKWAIAIGKCFPNEKSTTYFLPRQPGKKNRTGKLPPKWSNISGIHINGKVKCPESNSSSSHDLSVTTHNGN